MKTIFLILYLFQLSGHHDPVINIQEMPTLSACEAVGEAAVRIRMSRKAYRSITYFECISVKR